MNLQLFAMRHGFYIILHIINEHRKPNEFAAICHARHGFYIIWHAINAHRKPNEFASSCESIYFLNLKKARENSNR